MAGLEPFNDTWGCNATIQSSSPPGLCDSFLWPTIDALLRLENETETNMADTNLTYLRFRNLSRFWIQRVLVPIISFVGVVGNLVTIVIMTRRQMSSSTNKYLAGLAVFDMLYLLCIFILSIAHYPGLTDPHHINYWRFWPYALLLTDASSNTSVWLTVSFTIERYIAVCHPIKGKVYCTESRAKKVVIIIAFVCCCLTLPTPFEWTVVEVIDPQTNKTLVKPAFSEFGMNVLYKNIYYWLCVFLFVFIPLVLLAIFNSFLVRSVHASSVQRHTMTRRRDIRESSRQESKITIMLIAVVVLFMVCQMPTAVLLVYTTFHPQNAITRGLGNIFNFLMAINAAGNFVLYCLLSQKYRRTFLHIFCPCLKVSLVRLHMDFQSTSYTNVDDSSSMSRKASVLMSTRSLANIRKDYCGRRKSLRGTRRDLENHDSGKYLYSDERNITNPGNNRKRNVRRFVKFFPFFRQNWNDSSESNKASPKELEEECIPLKKGKHTICLTKTEVTKGRCSHSTV